VTTVSVLPGGRTRNRLPQADRGLPDTTLAAVVIVGQRTGRVVLAGARTVREVTGPDLPMRVDHRDPTADPTPELVDRLVAALATAVPLDVPVVLTGHPRVVDRACTDQRMLERVTATIPGHHEHTAPAILRAHALRILRRRIPTDHEVGRR
jgi:hypothetical protein